LGTSYEPPPPNSGRKGKEMSKINATLLALMALGATSKDFMPFNSPLGIPPGSKPYKPEPQSEESKQYYLKRAEEKRKRKGLRKDTQ
jgi:hypothetical protein